MNEEYSALSIIESTDMTSIQSNLNMISQFQQLVQSTLKKDHDYGVIPGTQKPTLYKPGAEKINMLFKINPEYEFMDRTADYQTGFFNYEIRCTLFRSIVQDGVLIKMPISQGVGSCNSKEKKYRYVTLKESELPVGIDKSTLRKATDKWGKTKYTIENPDPCSLANTILKMAKKRAYVDATLQVAALSEIFTQDLEDIDTFNKEELEQNASTASVDELGSFIINFGTKHKGKTVAEIFVSDKGYLEWLSEKSTDPEVKTVVTRYLSTVGNPTAPVAVCTPSDTTSVQNVSTPAQQPVAPSRPVQTAPTAPTVARPASTVSCDYGSMPLNFGSKHKGKTIREVAQDEASYLDWVVDKSNASDITKNNIKAYIASMKLAPKQAMPVTKDVTPADDDSGYVPPSDTDLPFDLT